MKPIAEFFEFCKLQKPRFCNSSKFLPLLSVLPITAAISIANFFYQGIGHSLALSAALAAVLFALWPVFSMWVSKVSGLKYSEALARGSLSYLPFCLLLLWPFSSMMQAVVTPSWGGFDVASLAANLFLKVLLALSLVLFVAVKALMLPEKVHSAVSAMLQKAKMNPKTVLAVMCLTYFIVMFSMSVIRFLTFKTPAPDLWIFNQAMWNTLHGDFMMTTRTLEFGNTILLGDHSFFILLFILPIYAIFSHPLTLYFVESAFITIAALPLYWIARSRFGERTALFFAAAFFLFPALQFVHLIEFQPLAFSIPFLLFSFHYLLQNRLRLFALFTALALFVRETQAPVVFLFGLYIAIAMRRRRLGAVVAASAPAWALFVLFFAFPFFGNPTMPTNGQVYAYIGGPENAFPNLGGSPGEIVSNILSDPLLLVREATTVRDFGYLMLIFLPVVFLPLFSAAVLVPASVFGLALLSGLAPHATIYFQYNAELIAFLFIAAVLGAERLIRLASKFISRQRALNTIFAALLASSIFSSVLFGPTPLSLLDPAPNAASFKIANYTITPHHELLLQVVASIPQGAVVSADSSLAAHLSGRRELYPLPINTGNYSPSEPFGYYLPKDFGKKGLSAFDYILIDATSGGWSEQQYDTFIGELGASHTFERLVDEDGVLLFKRIG